MNEFPHDSRKWLNEINHQSALRAHDRCVESFDKVDEAAISSANIALRTVLVINGGAAVALLTFVGAAPLLPDQKAAIASYLLLFVGGVVFSALGTGLVYFTHYFAAGAIDSRQKTLDPPYLVDTESSRTWSKWKSRFHIAAIVAYFGSIFLFVLGMIGVTSILTDVS